MDDSVEVGLGREGGGGGAVDYVLALELAGEVSDADYDFWRRWEERDCEGSRLLHGGCLMREVKKRVGDEATPVDEELLHRWDNPVFMESCHHDENSTTITNNKLVRPRFKKRPEVLPGSENFSGCNLPIIIPTRIDSTLC